MFKFRCPYTDCESLGKFKRIWSDESAQEKIFDQKKNLGKASKINHSFLRGFRLPFLDQAGNAHFRAVKKFNFNYDSSALIKPEDVKKNKNLRFWPHTLDFEPTYDCPTCPTRDPSCNGQSNCSMNSIWVVPMHYLNIEGFLLFNLIN